MTIYTAFRLISPNAIDKDLRNYGIDIDFLPLVEIDLDQTLAARERLHCVRPHMTNAQLESLRIIDEQAMALWSHGECEADVASNEGLWNVIDLITREATLAA